MTITATLVGGLFSARPGAFIDPATVDIRLPQSAFASPGITPIIAGGPPDALVAGTSPPLVLFGDWPTPLRVTQLLVPGEAAFWVTSAAGRTVESLLIDAGTYLLELDFNGTGPTARELVETWTWQRIMDLGPTINGIEYESKVPDPEEPDPEPVLPTAGDDDLTGTDGNDRINGLAGDDTIEGGAGKDRLLGAAGDDSLDGGSHNDVLNGGTGNDTLTGGDGRDKLLGGAGDDRIWDGAGDDLVRAGTGNDRIYVGAGNDRYDGGRGADEFHFTADTAGRKILMGFDVDEDRFFGKLALDPETVSGFRMFDAVRDALVDLGYDITFTGSQLRVEHDDSGAFELIVNFTEEVTEAEVWRKFLIDFG